MKKQAGPLKSSEEPAYLFGNRPLIIIAATIFLIYLPTLWYGFSPMDERWVILQHKEIMSDLHQLPGMFLQPTLGMYYRPVWTSSFIPDMVLGGGSAGLFHFTNILLHVLCATLVYRFFLQLKLTKTFAFFSALVFAVHPINVHAVAWIPGRNDSLLCLFALLSCCQLLSYFTTKKRRYLLFHLLAFGLALLSKENAIVLPFIYVLLWYLFETEKTSKHFFILLLSWIAMTVTWFCIRTSLINYFPPVSTMFSWNTITQFISALIIYIGKVHVPFQQSVMPVLKDTSVLPFAIITLLLTGMTLVFGLKNKKLALFGLAWFFIFILIPVWVGATNSHREHYEHRIYTSVIGMFIFLSQLKITVPRKIVLRVACLLLIVFSVKTIYRSTAYKDEITFLQSATKESPSIDFFHDMLGFKYAELKEYKNALECFNKAILLNPHKTDFYNNRGNVYFQLKNYKLALADFNKSMEGNKGQSVKFVNRSMTNFYLGNHTDALHDLEAAQKAGAEYIAPEYVDALYEAFQKDTIALCTTKLSLDSTDASTYNTRGIAKMRLGLFKEALSDFNKALGLRPGSAAIRSNRPMALSNLPD
ncbi:MAG: tetratricopeptide repeat protein [Bacteroidota bacterium]|nr:tetratricopeptide repeat protein [Bacteroidota bacterium]